MKNHAYGICKVEGSDIDYISVSGKDISPPEGEWIKLHIRYIGSHLELYVNGVQVAKANVYIGNSQLQAVSLLLSPLTAPKWCISPIINFTSERWMPSIRLRFREPKKIRRPHSFRPIASGLATGL